MPSETIATYDLIKEIFFLLDDGDRQLLGQFDLTVPRFYALFHLGYHPGLSPNQLSDLMFCDKSNITRLIKGMEGDGLVKRRRHESDGRSIRLYLTHSGENLRERALRAHDEYNKRRFDDNILAQVNYLRRSLETLRESLQQELDNGFDDILEGGGA